MGKFELLSLDGKLPTGRRTLIIGPPNSLKTTSLLTFPKTLAVVSYYGEKGYDTIPTDDSEVLPFTWRIGPDEDITKQNAHEIVRETETITAKIIAGKFGDSPVVTFAGDGIHKLYDSYYLRARKDLDTYDKLDDSTKDARAYGIAHKDFVKYLSWVNHSSIPYAVFTCWVGREKDDPDDKRKDASTHLWPALPGQMAQLILGEFSVVMYADAIPEKPGSKILKGRWQLKPEGKVWGVGVKANPKLVATLPTHVDANWATLEPILLGGKK